MESQYFLVLDQVGPCFPRLRVLGVPIVLHNQGYKLSNQQYIRSDLLALDCKNQHGFGWGTAKGQEQSATYGSRILKMIENYRSVSLLSGIHVSMDIETTLMLRHVMRSLMFRTSGSICEYQQRFFTKPPLLWKNRWLFNRISQSFNVPLKSPRTWPSAPGPRYCLAWLGGPPWYSARCRTLRRRSRLIASFLISSPNSL